MPKVEWKPKRVKDMNRLIVESTNVPEATHAAADALAEVYEARLAPHHANNAHNPGPHSHINVSRGKVDAFVNLDDAGGDAAYIGYTLGIFDPFAWEGSAGRTPGAI